MLVAESLENQDEVLMNERYQNSKSASLSSRKKNQIKYPESIVKIETTDRGFILGRKNWKKKSRNNGI